MDAITDHLGLFGHGLLGTLKICLFAAIGALLLGTAVASCRVSPVPPLRWLGTGWVTIFRNCPLTVVLFFAAFGIPEIGINGSYFTFGVLALVVYTSAFVCEAIRSGINAVPTGQAEAARAIGLNFTQVLTIVVLPQALRTVVPPLGSVIIAMIKNSAIVGAFGVGNDLFSVGVNLTGAKGYAALPSFLGVAIGFLIITIPAGLALGVLERRVAVLR